MADIYAAIFDMDGVLVDTYRAHYESWVEMARTEGLDMTEEEFARTFGRTSREVIAGLWGKDLGDEKIAAMDAKKEVAFRRIIEAHVPVMPGAVELLHSLRGAGFRLAVGSSGPAENVDLVLDRMGVREMFDAVVTGNDVTRGKPDPQVFLIAATRLGVAPRRCAVLEDAPPGVAAARAGGMVAVGVASTGRTRAALAEAALVVDSLAGVSPQALRSLIDRRDVPAGAGEVRSHGPE